MANKLRIENNWEELSYYTGNTQLKDIKIVSINGERVKLRKKWMSVPYSDMGHCYTGNSNHYFFSKNIKGKKTEFDLYDFRNEDIEVIE